MRAIAAIAEADWLPIDYSLSGEAQVAETAYRELRLVVRRTRLVGAQAELFPEFARRAEEAGLPPG